MTYDFDKLIDASKDDYNLSTFLRVRFEDIAIAQDRPHGWEYEAFKQPSRELIGTLVDHIREEAMTRDPQFRESRKIAQKTLHLLGA